MTTRKLLHFALPVVSLAISACSSAPDKTAFSVPGEAEMDARIEALMQAENIPGMAVAVIDGGETVYMKAFGDRTIEPQLSLKTDTVMYGASLTKFVFASYVMQLVEAGTLELDVPLATYFPRPLPDYEEWADLADQPQWQYLTLRHVLNHSTGWGNYRFFPPEEDYAFTPDAKLRFFYEPGERYGYSGEAFILVQRALEEGLGIDLTTAMDEAIFAPQGMKRTSMIWQEDFAEDENFARGYGVDGENLGHNLQDNARSAGSMDTTLEDYTALTKAFLAGDIVSEQSMAEMLRPQLAITSDTKFPTLARGANPERNRAVNLSVGLGVVVWDGPQGHGFMKAGHNEKTDNMMLCLSDHDRCFVAMMNTAKGDLVYPQLVEELLGPTGFPWTWEYASLNEGG
jgi:CubicO group peptidase (beta-lactamase class C family)